MKFYKVSAVVLKSVSIREADQLLTLFTREKGKIRVMAYGSCKLTSRKRGAVQPFSHSRFLIRRGSGLDTVSQGELVEMFPQLRCRLDKLGCAVYLTAMVDDLTAEEEPGEEIFNLLLKTLRSLVSGDGELLIRAFEVKLLSILGYRPCLERCVLCHVPVDGSRVVFHAGAGGILCPSCAGKETDGLTCSRGTVELLKLFLRWEPGRLNQLKAGQLVRRELKEVLHRHLEYHLGQRMKSMRFLELLGHV
ncbi:DNA repair protein RecO [Desulfofundulus thermocisternus]|uniref:DNA repair protein RecO n=1 Tax=Desulfofundulus thermocisternus TaxID=42471 RepID=UPI0019FD5AC1|nr:DNA repair protein RecO [Desulfofundulus thermocisternus]MBE3585557.1 DNA repair protein RecO [Thermoanaerobacter sp.]MCS5696172.1 DNA repair protein RecO [Desulfofundulus thermocisternus]